MTYAELKQAVKAGTLPPLLLLYGEEAYFVAEAVRLVLDGVLPEDARDFNFSVYQGRDIKAVDLVDQARTFPVFADRRVILLKEIQDANADQLDGLNDYLDDPVPETLLVVTGGKIDSRRKFFKKIKKVGAFVEFKRVYDNQLPSLVRDMAREKGLSFASGALELFCKRVGTSLAEVNGELDKLTSYLGERKLADEPDVDAVVSDTRIESVFDLTDALGEGRQAEALRLLSRLLEDGQPPLMVLAMLTRHFRQLWKARELVEQNTPQQELARKVGINPYFLKGVLRQARYYKPEDYRFLFERFLAVDLSLKSTGADARASLEVLMLEIGRRGEAARA